MCFVQLGHDPTGVNDRTVPMSLRDYMEYVQSRNSVPQSLTVLDAIGWPFAGVQHHGTYPYPPGGSLSEWCSTPLSIEC